MRRYLLYSGSAHVLILGTLFFVLKAAPALKPAPVYTVSFIGNQAAVTAVQAQTQTPAQAAAKSPVKTQQPPQKKAAQKNTKPAITDGKPVDKKPGPLRPSLLGETPSLLEDLPPQAQEMSDTEIEQQMLEDGTVTAEFPNFPYPWYITRVRIAIWNQWSTRMPSDGSISAVVSFTIRPDGKIKDVKIARSSGNKLFDYAALVSAEQAAPFAPLPKDFKKPELVVHVEFKVTG